MKRDRMRDLPAAAIRLCLLACVLMLTACGSLPPIPPQKDAAVGIFPGERPKSPLAKVPAGPEVKAVAVLSENTLANTAWKRKIQGYRRENEVLMRALRKFDSSLAQQVSGPPPQAAGGYDACLQRALAAQDPQLRVAAMAACDAAR